MDRLGEKYPDLDPGLLKTLKGSVVLIKYGGNAMTEESARENVYDQVAALQGLGLRIVIVHGGGPVIKSLLESVGIESEFIGGHRKTDKTAMKYVEMALSGQVNGEIVKGLNSRGVKAVGLSGKDGGMVRAGRRFHYMERAGRKEQVDLGFVGDVVSIDTDLISTLLTHEYVPVLAPIGTGIDQMDYNINADMFAGHMAGALQAASYISMTDVDGLREKADDPGSLLKKVDAGQLEKHIGRSILGGMIPKVESCLIALEKGVKEAHIVNGMKADTLIIKLLTNRQNGTTIEA